MKTVEVVRTMTAATALSMVGDKVPDLPPTEFPEPAMLIDAATGDEVMIYLPLDRAWVVALRTAVIAVAGSPSGKGSMGRGRVSAASRSFGYMPRRPVYGREGCQASRLADETPASEAVLDGLAGHLQALLSQLAPERLQRDLEAASAIDPSWRLGDSLYTSGVINTSATLPYHTDRFNFPVISAMPVLRRNMAGGHLHIPEYDITVPCRDGWVVFFPGQQLVHGVTPMRLTAPDGYRYSVVYYALRGMKDCYTAAVETAEARRKRTTREREMAARIAEGGQIRPEDGLPLGGRGDRFAFRGKMPGPETGLPRGRGSGRMIGGRTGFGQGEPLRETRISRKGSGRMIGGESNFGDPSAIEESS